MAEKKYGSENDFLDLLEKDWQSREACECECNPSSNNYWIKFTKATLKKR